jgi:ABC-type nitrate/sulfonate/bicarbonate transport system ATPase subunit
LNLEPSTLEVVDLSKDYHGLAGAKQHVLQNVSLEVNLYQEKGTIVSVLAPFGAGKTTLLKMICGIEKPTSGEVILTGRKYNLNQMPGKIVYIPENPSSFPWYNVEENIKFAASLKSRIVDPKKIEKLISIVGLEGYQNHFPHDKSLGFRFRISLARALTVEPQLLLLDDPLKNLNNQTKKEIKELILFIADELHTSIILTTTNIHDSISISDELYLMKKNPGMIFDKIRIDRLKIIEKNGDYFTSLKRQIEKAFAVFDNSSLISEAKEF